MTRRRNFPVPGYPLIELPTSPMEEMLLSHGSGAMVIVVVLGAMYLQRQAANGLNDYEDVGELYDNDAINIYTDCKHCVKGSPDVGRSSASETLVAFASLFLPGA